MPGKSRLRTKILIFIIILAVVPILIFGYLSIYLLSFYHQQNIFALERQLIEQKNREIDKFLTDTLGILEIRVAYTQKSDIELSQQFFLLDGLLSESKAFEEVSFFDLNGQETAKEDRSGNALELTNVSALPNFQQVAQGHNYIGEVYYTLSGPALTMSAPIRNRNDEIIQYLSAEVNLSTLNNIIKGASLGSTGYMVLLDSNGVIMADGSKVQTEHKSLMNSSRVRSMIEGDLFDRRKSEERYISSLSHKAVAGTAKKVNNTNWMLLAEWPSVEADAMITTLRDQVVLFDLFGVVAVLLLTPFFAEHLARPVRELKMGAQEIQKGNFEKRVVIKTKDEIEELGEAFNEMAKGLKRLQELRDEFVFIAAHELRAPVTAIRGYVSMVLEGDAGPIDVKLKEMLDPVMTSTEGLNKLVNDLLEVAQSDAGRIEIKVHPCGIVREVQSTLNELKILSDAKGIVLIYEPSNDAPQIMADESKLKEVLKNLVDNAIKYTLGAGTVMVSHEVKEQMLITHVQDTGMGISAEKQEKLFQKFYRAKTKETEEIQGTGLGLWIIKQLVEKMNGKIWVESTEGQGSIFSFSLPLAQT